MDRRITVSLFLVVLWFLTGGILMVVSGQPTVTATILTPEADRKEGGRVEMRCVARNLEANHIVEWMTEDPIKSLRWGTATIAGTDQRFIFGTKQTSNREITQEYNITGLQRGDTNEYICNVKDPIPSGGHHIVATDTVNLSVSYFPSESFPFCSAKGPMTVDTGTQLNLRCFSEKGNPTAMMHVFQPPPGLNTDRYAWMTSINNDVINASLDLTVDVQDHDALFECRITSSYFPGMTRSCTIGPVTVTGAISPTQQTPKEQSSEVSIVANMAEQISFPTTQTSSLSEVPMPTKLAPSSSGVPTALIADASACGVNALLLLVILIIICRRRGLCHSQPKPPASQTQPTPNDDTVFTTDPTINSQQNIYQDTRHQTQGTLTIPNGNIYYDPSEITSTASSSPERSWDVSPAPPVTVRAPWSSTPLYATPHGQTSSSTLHDARAGNLHQSTQQVYSNPAFDSQQSDPTPGPSGGPPRPTARVPPMQGVPIKPKPFKPKPQRATRSQDGTLGQQDHQLASEAHGTPSARQVHLDNADGNHPSSSTNKGPVYAIVMKTGQNQN